MGSDCSKSRLGVLLACLRLKPDAISSGTALRSTMVIAKPPRPGNGTWLHRVLTWGWYGIVVIGCRIWRFYLTPKAIFARVRATGRLWNTLLVALDAAVVVVSTVAAYYARFEGVVPAEFDRWMTPLTLVAIVLYGVLFALFGLYRLVLRYVGVDVLLRIVGAVVIGFSALLAADIVLALPEGLRRVPVGVLFIQAVLVLLGASAARLAARVYLYVRSQRSPGGRRVLIVGAGNAGSLLLRELHNRTELGMSVVGFLDDNRSLMRRTISGVPVLGTTGDLSRIVTEREIDEVIVALPTAPHERVRALLNEAAGANVQTRVMPPIVVQNGSVSVGDLRKVDVEDLLGREPTRIDTTEIAGTLTGRVVAVTGAAGSIGSELCRQIMAFEPEKLLLIEIDESRLYETWLELRRYDENVPVMCICDIRDREALDAVMATHQPHVLLHAAAYKHVPLMQLAPQEAVKTNVQGTLQVIEACERHGTDRFVLISTDKAVDPVNVMGLTKALAERVMLDAVRRGRLNAVAVRFGNVLGSRGSVVPLFEEQLRRGGPLTVTDPEVTRYFMTIPEAARLVLQAQAIGRPGDIFVLEMGEPVRIAELARKMSALAGVPAEIIYTGLRPGEKMHEELICDAERLVASSRDNIWLVDRVVVPDSQFDQRIRLLIDHAVHRHMSDLDAAIESLEPGFGVRNKRMYATCENAGAPD